jgi:hypothetical protein
MFWRVKSNAVREQFRENARERLRAEGYDALFHDHPGDEIPPDFPDLWLLRNAVLSAKPSLILEYGSGYSTYVMAKTLQSIGRGRIISVELAPGWRCISQARLPPDLAPLVEFVSPEPKIRMAMALLPGGAPDLWFKKKSKQPRRLGIATIAFPELSNLEPEFVFVDGPERSQIPGYVDSVTNEPLPPIVSDPIVFAIKKSPIICVDGRREQCVFLSANLPAGYKAKVYEVQRFTFFYPPHTSP